MADSGVAGLPPGAPHSYRVSSSRAGSKDTRENMYLASASPANSRAPCRTWHLGVKGFLFRNSLRSNELHSHGLWLRHRLGSSPPRRVETRSQAVLPSATPRGEEDQVMLLATGMGTALWELTGGTTSSPPTTLFLPPTACSSSEKQTDPRGLLRRPCGVLWAL